MGYIIGIAVALIAYLIGSLNTSIIISKLFFKEDIRDFGSKNAGATNMLRTHGKKFGVLTLIFDLLKGVVAVLLAVLVSSFMPTPMGDNSSFSNAYLLTNLPYIAGFFVVLGHSFPIYFSFAGGKGVATGLGVMLTLNWQVGLIVMLISLIIMAVTRYVSLGSIIGALLFPVMLFCFKLGEGSFSVVSIIMTSALCILIIARHHSNISRLLNGTENKLFSKKDKR